jgi:hypothetical protein
MNTFSKVAGYRINVQNPVGFPYNNNIEKEIRKIIPFTIIPK